MPDWQELYRDHQRRHPKQAEASYQFTAIETASMMAVDAYKRANRRPFLELSELLAILTAIGWTPPAVPEGESPLPTHRLRARQGAIKILRRAGVDRAKRERSAFPEESPP